MSTLLADFYGICQCQQCTIHDDAVSLLLQSHDIVRLQ